MRQQGPGHRQRGGNDNLEIGNGEATRQGNTWHMEPREQRRYLKFAEVRVFPEGHGKGPCDGHF
eukprot:3493817-Lingulodinium_polyedra.AAC.1